MFDSDSYPIAVDNCASHCMTNDKADFVRDTVMVQINVTGVGQTQAMEMGMLLWIIVDNDGTAHEELIPNSYFVPQLPGLCHPNTGLKSTRAKMCTVIIQTQNGLHLNVMNT